MFAGPASIAPKRLASTSKGAWSGAITAHARVRDFAEGGGNTFGVEFDGEGRCFRPQWGRATRGWHFVQSGIYLKQGKDPGKFGPPANPYAFVELPMMKSLTTITRFSHHFAVSEGEALPLKYQAQTIVQRGSAASERCPERASARGRDLHHERHRFGIRKRRQIGATCLCGQCAGWIDLRRGFL